jgi:hypothetical protein
VEDVGIAGNLVEVRDRPEHVEQDGEEVGRFIDAGEGQFEDRRSEDDVGRQGADERVVVARLKGGAERGGGDRLGDRLSLPSRLP